MENKIKLMCIKKVRCILISFFYNKRHVKKIENFRGVSDFIFSYALILFYPLLCYQIQIFPLVNNYKDPYGGHSPIGPVPHSDN